MAEFIEIMKTKQRMCKCKIGQCDQCGLYSLNNKTGDNCDYFILRNYEEAEEIIMKWAKEHPIKTNADKFKEVFGVDTELELEMCSMKCPEGTFNMVSNGCNDCKYKDFWKQEYKETKGE